MGINRSKTLSAARKQVRKGNWEKAIRKYRELVDDNPDDMRSLLKIADLLVKAGREQKALDTYQRVAHYYVADQIYEKAVAVFKQALRIDADNADLNRDLGEAYHRLGRLKEALRSYYKAERIYKASNDTPSQRGVLERMVELDPEDVGLKIQLAERYAKDGLTDEAIDLFETAATSLEEDGRLGEWLQVAERLIYLSPRHADRMRGRVARLYSNRDDHRRALRHLQAMFKQNPEREETLELLGFTFVRLDKPEKALMVYHELAKGMMRDEREEEAVEIYRRILEVDPEDRRARKVLARRKKRQQLEDSGSLLGIDETGPGIPPGEEADDALDGVEFLDEDLAAELSGGQSAAPAEPEQVPAARGASPDSAPAPTPESRGPAPQTRQPGASTPDSSTHNRGVGPAAGSQTAPPQNRGPSADAQRNQPDPFSAFAEDAILELGDVDIERIDDNPSTGLAAGPERDPGEEQKFRSLERVQEMLTETQVFIKYNLFERALELLTKIVEYHPTLKEARKQLAIVYEKKGEPRRAAEEFLELARQLPDTPDFARAFLDRAANLGADPQQIREVRDQIDDEIEEIELIDVEPLEEISSAVEEELSGVQEDGSQEIRIESLDDGIEFLDDEEPDSDSDEIDFLDLEDEIDFLDLEDEFAGPSHGIEEHTVAAQDSASLAESMSRETAPPADEASSTSLAPEDEGLSLSTEDVELLDEPQTSEIDIDESLDDEDFATAGADDSFVAIDADDSFVEFEEDDGFVAIDADDSFVEFEEDEGLVEILPDDSFITDEASLAEDTDVEDIDDFAFEDEGVAEMVDVDLGDMPAAEGLDLDSLDHEDDSEDEGVDLDFSSADADAMFDGLFGDMSAAESAPADGQNGAVPVPPAEQREQGAFELGADFGDIDELIDQNMFAEAADALEQYQGDGQAPAAEVDQRRIKINARRQGAGDNEFGEQSLSRKIQPDFLDEPSRAAEDLGGEASLPGVDVGDSINTNLEIGASYLEQGLFDDAIQEFSQALDDPEVAAAAAFQIARCHFKKGDPETARRRLEALLADESTPDNVRQWAHDLLARVERAS